MAGKRPSFITGANAKIKIGNITMAYAQGISYNVTVTAIPVKSMGRYEAVSHEPVDYMVEGSFSVVRYTSAATPGEGSQITPMPGVSPLGNGPGAWNLKSRQPLMHKGFKQQHWFQILY